MPVRLLANASFIPSGDHAGSIWKNRRADDDESASDPVEIHETMNAPRGTVDQQVDNASADRAAEKDQK